MEYPTSDKYEATDPSLTESQVELASDIGSNGSIGVCLEAELSSPTMEGLLCSEVACDAEEEKAQLAQLETIRVAAESEAEIRATEKRRLNAAIKTLSQVATEQIDRMDEAKARLAVLEQIRLHAETKVYERAEREIRLEAEIEALRQTEAAQLKRIEEAEVEARRLTEEQTRVNAAAETRRRAAAEVLQQVEHASRRLAEEEEQRLEHLEAIRAKAEAAAQKRAEKERMLNSQLLAFSEAAAEQIKRIEKAEADLRQAEQALLQFEENARARSEQVANRLAELDTLCQVAVEEHSRTEAKARTLAEEEQPPLGDLEMLGTQAEPVAQHHADEEQPLIAEIEALQEIQAHQPTEVTLAATKEELQEAEWEQNVDLGTGVVTVTSDETEALPNDLQAGTYNVETATSCSTSGPSSQSSVSATDEVELLSNESIVSTVSEAGLQVASEEIPSLASLAESFRTVDPVERAKVLQELARLDKNDAFSVITGLFDDSSEEVRNGAARALYELSTDRAEAFTHALREAPPERRRQIIRALESSGLAAEAIDRLAEESREKTYDAYSLLFLMAKAGEFQSLLQTIVKHHNSSVRLTIIKMLTFSGRPEIIPALRSLAVRGALPIEVRSALMESIYQMSSNARERAA